MKKRNKIILVLFFVLILGAAAYFYLRPKAAIQVIFPDLKELRKVKVRLLPDTALISFEAIVKNKSFMKLNIDSIYYNVWLDTTELLEKKEFVDLELDPGNEEKVSFRIALPSKSLRSQIRELQDQDSAVIHFKLKIHYKTWFGRAILPVERDVPILTPVPPVIEFLKTEYKGRDKRTVMLDAHLKIENKGHLDIEIKNIRYHADVEDLFSVDESYPKKVVLKPQTTQTLILPVKVEVKKLFKTAFKVLTDNDNVSYKLKMTADVKADPESEELTPVEVRKDGKLELKK